VYNIEVERMTLTLCIVESVPCKPYRNHYGMWQLTIHCHFYFRFSY